MTLENLGRGGRNSSISLTVGLGPNSRKKEESGEGGGGDDDPNIIYFYALSITQIKHEMVIMILTDGCRMAY